MEEHAAPGPYSILVGHTAGRPRVACSAFCPLDQTRLTPSSLSIFALQNRSLFPPPWPFKTQESTSAPKSTRPN